MIPDYVVVGAGSAGCAVAARLSEDSSNDVVLIDAGRRDWSPSIHVPAGIIFGRNNFDWAYRGEADNSRGGREEIWSAGSTFGGSSAINGMMYVRGNAADFDAWADAGCEGWGYESVLPYFRRMESWEDGESDYRGGNGPVHVVRDPVRHALTGSFVQASEAAGFAFNDDYNGKAQDGVALVQANQKRGLRHTAARAYLGWWNRRRNLRVIHHAEVTRTIFDGRRAVGVEFLKNAELQSLQCKREVVLSAGALVSPKILMQSGIGPGPHLQSHGIDVLLDRPGVGENFHEHAVTAMSWEVNVPTLNTEKMFSVRAIRHGFNYLFRHRGPLAACVGAAQIFFRLDPQRRAPDLQIIFLPMGYQLTESDRSVELRLHPKPHVTVAIAALQPMNRGTIRLRSSNARDTPRIHFELLGAKDTVAKLTVGAKTVREIMAQDAFKPFVVKESLPGAELATEDDGAWEEFISEATMRGDHPCGSCRMGAADDPMAVVDPQLRVIGVGNLRVADASIMPMVTSGNTNAPVMMIGERAADFIQDSARI